MILQALYEYYKRRDDLPKPGFELKEFKYELILDPDGTFRELACVVSENKRGLSRLVPRSCKRSGVLSEDKPFLLWDTVDFVLGESGKGEAATEKDKATALRKRANFLAKLEALPEAVRKSQGVHAVLEFYHREEYAKVPAHELWADLLKSNSNLVFRLRGEVAPVTSDPAVVDFVMADASADAEADAPQGRCLITGERGELIRLMGATPIVGGKSTSSLVSFQKNSGYDSYGKEQCFNAPIGKQAEFACSTALNALLGKDSRNKFLLGDMTLLFWTQKAERTLKLADLLFPLLRQEKDDPDYRVESVRAMLKSAYTGKLPRDEAENRFYFLGLAPNAARISVAVWKVGTIGELGRNFEQFLLDFDLEAGEKIRRPTTVYGVLTSLALEYKLENLARNLEGRFLAAIIDGTPYPVTLLIQAINRIRADRKLLPLRIATVKACLNRKNRFDGNQNKELTMSLDPENPNIGYQCGRLFAVLEKAQAEANPGINATICDRFYGAASTTPVTVFGRLLALNLHHLEKLTPGRKIGFRNLAGEIIDRISDFPAHLSLEDQGRFAIGYYHQNQELYRSKKTVEPQTEPEQN